MSRIIINKFDSLTFRSVRSIMNFSFLFHISFKIYNLHENIIAKIYFFQYFSKQDKKNPGEYRLHCQIHFLPFNMF